MMKMHRTFSKSALDEASIELNFSCKENNKRQSLVSFHDTTFIKWPLKDCGKNKTNTSVTTAGQSQPKGKKRKKKRTKQNKKYTRNELLLGARKKYNWLQVREHMQPVPSAGINATRAKRGKTRKPVQAR